MNDILGRTLLGRYHVEAFVGRGGMAEVFKVWDTKRAAHLAAKFLREDLAEDRIFLRRFRREAETLTRLQHPNIVRSYGLEEEGPLAFLLMDYVDGASLRRRIHEAASPFSSEETVRVAKSVCAALHYAHLEGIVHGDVKPGNILLAKGGSVLISDFGIARMAEATTATLIGAGTPAYMAPEVVRGEPPTPQADLYGLGVVLYEMLTGGERPFTGERAKVDGSTAEKVRWEQIHLPPSSPRSLNSSIPFDVESVILGSLSKEPAQRQANALELSQALERGFASEHAKVGVPRGGPHATPRVWEAPTRDEGPAQPASRPRDRRRVGILLAAGLLVALVGVSVAVASRSRQAEIVGEASQAADATTMGAWALPSATPTAVAARTPSPSLPPTATPRAASIPQPRPITLANASQLRVWWELPSIGTQIEVLAWRPSDGLVLAVGGCDSRVHLWGASTWEEQPPLPVEIGCIRGLAWSPDGGRLAASGQDGSIRVWDVATGSPLHSWDAHGTEARGLSWSPDGRFIASGGGDNRVRVWDTTDFHQVQELRYLTAVYSVSWSPDSVWLAGAGSYNSVVIWTPDQALSAGTAMAGRYEGLWDVVWLPGGDRVAAASFGPAFVWDIRSGQIVQTITAPNGCTSLSLSHDSSMLACGGTDLFLWNAATFEEVLRITWQGDDARVAWSPDGTLLASAGTDGSVRLWSTSTDG